MNKTKLTILILTVLALSLVPIVSAENAVMTVQLLKYEPIPAQPGQYVTVYLEMKNIGNEDSGNAAIIIDNQFPFTTLSKSESYKSFGVIKSQQSVVESFKIKVASDAIIGTNQLKVRYTKDEKTNTWQEKTLNIDVKTNDASLTISEVESTPEEFVPGGEGQVNITIKNNEKTTLRNIGVQIGLIKIQGSNVLDLPFIPTGSATEKKISRLNPGEFRTISFNVKTYPSATPGYYKLPVSLTFYDDQGTKIENQDYIGTIIKAQPELKIYLDETTITPEKKQGEITLKFVNKGISNLRFLDIELINGDNYKVLSTKSDYIGDLDSDDYRSETFTIETKSKDVKLQVKIDYKDENNKDYSYITTVPLEYNNIPTKNSKSGAWTIIFVIIALGLIIYFWRKNKNKKRRH